MCGDMWRNTIGRQRLTHPSRLSTCFTMHVSLKRSTGSNWVCGRASSAACYLPDSFMRLGAGGPRSPAAVLPMLANEARDFWTPPPSGLSIPDWVVLQELWWLRHAPGCRLHDKGPVSRRGTTMMTIK